MTTAIQESAGDKSSLGQLDLRDPYDLATFEHQMILVRGLLHPGASPSLMTTIRSLWSEDARAELEGQNAVCEGAEKIRNYVLTQILGDRSAKPCVAAVGGGLKISSAPSRRRFRQGV